MDTVNRPFGPDFAWSATTAHGFWMISIGLVIVEMENAFHAMTENANNAQTVSALAAMALALADAGFFYSFLHNL